MPWPFIQAISFFTSAMTSGPMPSPGSSRSLWVAIVAVVPRRSHAVVPASARHRRKARTPGRLGMTARIRGLLKPAAGIGKHGRDAPKPCHDSSHRPRLRSGGIPGRRTGADAIRAAVPIHPLSGAAISVPSFTLLFICISPILLRGETIVWHAVPIFVAVGLVFPARADDSHLRVEPRARPGGDRRARQSVAAVLGRRRGSAAARAASACCNSPG